MAQKRFNLEVGAPYTALDLCPHPSSAMYEIEYTCGKMHLGQYIQ